MAESNTRPRGILTQADRKYLTGQKDLSPQSERNTRRRIRNRVFYALQDFRLLWLFLEEDDLELIFDAESQSEKRTIRRSIQDMIAFSILGLWKNNDYYPPRLKASIQQAAYSRNRQIHVELNVEEQLMDPSDEILTRLLDSGFENTTFEEYEKAMTDPNADPELLRSMLAKLLSEEITVDDIKEGQAAWRDAPLVRKPFPVVTHVEPVFDE